MKARRIVRRSLDHELPQTAANLHPVLRRVYAARGVTSVEGLDLALSRLLPVGSLGGVAAAVDLLMAAHAHDRRIVVVGDFDTDGATSTALVVRQLLRLGFRDPD
jgi:single-stranded-DNA-specific exonuclease